MIQDDIIDDIEIACEYLRDHDDSIIAIRNRVIFEKNKGEGIRPFLELIRDTQHPLSDCVIGDRILGKASALLCCYVNTRGVYAPQGTKTAIATLLIHAIPTKVDTVVPHITNRTGDGLCPFEQLLSEVDDPKEAYHLLSQRLMV
jgi:hypothetical protein